MSKDKQQDETEYQMSNPVNKARLLRSIAEAENIKTDNPPVTLSDSEVPPLILYIDEAKKYEPRGCLLTKDEPFSPSLWVQLKEWIFSKR